MAISSQGQPRAIIIGCGTAGIALAARLKTKLNFHNFDIFEREKALGGTWYLNTYPGVGCDVDSHLYSFSFNPNPDWTKRFAEQAEILQYLNDTVDKFGIRQHLTTGCEVAKAEWSEKRALWEVTLRKLPSGELFVKEAEILISCVGTISIPKDCAIPNWQSFKGTIWHSARWNHSYDMRGKTVAVVGNGCSAAQLVPFVIKDAAKTYQFQRSPQWINERPNSEFTAFQKWCFRYVPLCNRVYRFLLWKRTDDLHNLYQSTTSRSINNRENATKEAVAYMKQTAPAKYHDMLIPKFPLGCKRRIFDPGYLESLYNENFELTTEPIQEFTETGIRTDRRSLDVDAIILSTGFKIQEFLSPITVVGKNGISLNEHWKSTQGAQAYKATFVSGFPNFGIVFGPNAFPSHNSVIYTNEVQAEFIIKTVFKPILKGYFSTVEVKESAEYADANGVQDKIKSMVWSSGCSNWNLDANGRNTTNYHGNTWMFWYHLYWPVWNDFVYGNDTGKRPMHPLYKILLGTIVIGCIFGLNHVLPRLF